MLKTVTCIYCHQIILLLVQIPLFVKRPNLRNSCMEVGVTYISSKYALEALGDALRVEMAPLGISVSLVEPGYLESGMIEGKDNNIVKSFLDSTEAGERKLYPHLVDGKYPHQIREISLATGRMEETCEAVSDAIFSKYPKTRYITSRVGPFPSWLAVRIFSLLPDRLGDWATDHLEIVIGALRLRTSVEHLLGIRR